MTDQVTWFLGRALCNIWGKYNFKYLYTFLVNVLFGGQHGTGNVKMDKLNRCLIECHSQIHVYKSMEINDGSGNLLFGQSFV